MSQAVRSRLMKGFAAQGFAQVTNLIIQFGSIPLFLYFWGKTLYGEWLLLSTIPSYFALSDLGFASAAGTEMTLRVGRGDREGALKVFQSAWVLVTGISLLITLAMLGTASLLPLARWLHLSTLSHGEIVKVVSILVFQVFFDLQTGLIGNGYRCDGNYAAGTMVRQAQRLAEFAVAALVLLLGGQLVAMALSVTLTRLAGNLLTMFDVRRRSPWLTFGWKHADVATIRLIASPALSFMGFPIGNALSLQGITTVVGITFGPAVVVAFNTSRTLTRAVWQLLNAITNTIWVELSSAFGRGDIALARSLHRRACQAALWIAVLSSIVLFFAGSTLYHVWTGRQIVFDPTLFGLLLIVGIANSLWSTSYTVIVAVNRHQQLAAVYIAATGLSLALAYVLTPLMGLHGTALSLLVIDLFMSTYVVVRSLVLVEDSLPAFVRFVLTPPLRNQIVAFWQKSYKKEPKTKEEETPKIQGVTKLHTSASIHLDAIRGLAALLVFWSHIRALFFAPYESVAHRNVLVKVLYFFDGFGHSAVMVFFVLSGFLISSSVLRSLETRRWSWGWYAQNRLTRLYVVLVPALLLGAFWDLLGMHVFGLGGVYGSNPHYTSIVPEAISQTASWGSWLGNLFFLQTIFVPPYGSNAPLWSLSYEFWYYLLFPISVFILSRRQPGRVRLTCCAVAVLIAALIGKGILLYFPIWLMGTALCFLPSAGHTVRRWLCPFGSLLLIATLMLQRSHRIHSAIGSDYLLAGAFTFFLYGVLGSRNMVPALYERLARFFSGISYTLYLVHIPFLFFVTAFVIGSRPLWQPDLMHLGVGVLVLAAALSYTCSVWLLTEAHTDQMRKIITNRLPKPVETRAPLKMVKNSEELIRLK